MSQYIIKRDSVIKKGLRLECRLLAYTVSSGRKMHGIIKEALEQNECTKEQAEDGSLNNGTNRWDVSRHVLK